MSKIKLTDKDIQSLQRALYAAEVENLLSEKQVIALNAKIQSKDLILPDSKEKSEDERVYAFIKMLKHLKDTKMSAIDIALMAEEHFGL